MLNKEQDILLTVNFPQWVRVFYTICLVLFATLMVVIGLWMLYADGSRIDMWKVILLFILLAGGAYMLFRYIFYDVVATKSGLESKNLFAKRKKLIRWDEIVEVRRPRLVIPYDFSYVITEGQERMNLIRSMRNYEKLIELIIEKAPNLKKCERRTSKGW